MDQGAEGDGVNRIVVKYRSPTTGRWRKAFILPRADGCVDYLFPENATDVRITGPREFIDRVIENWKQKVPG